MEGNYEDAKSQKKINNENKQSNRSFPCHLGSRFFSFPQCSFVVLGCQINMGQWNTQGKRCCNPIHGTGRRDFRKNLNELLMACCSPCNQTFVRSYLLIFHLLQRMPHFSTTNLKLRTLNHQPCYSTYLKGRKKERLQIKEINYDTDKISVNNFGDTGHGLNCSLPN